MIENLSDALIVIEEQKQEIKKLRAKAPNTAYAKCVIAIFDEISSRKHFDLYSCDKDIQAEIKQDLCEILETHFA